jgi:hypothetical protein
MPTITVYTLQSINSVMFSSELYTAGLNKTYNATSHQLSLNFTGFPDFR